MNDYISIVCTITQDTGSWVVLQLCKATVVISREQFIDGLRRGKTWRRQQALATRLEAPEPGQS